MKKIFVNEEFYAYITFKEPNIKELLSLDIFAIFLNLAVFSESIEWLNKNTAFGEIM